MSWANYIQKLEAGESVQFRPRGNSMSGLIESGQLVTVAPITEDIEVKDIVLCKVKGEHFLHLVKSIRGNQYQIANNKGRINGWITDHAIYGKVVKIED